MKNLLSTIQGCVYGKIIGNRLGLSYANQTQDSIIRELTHLTSYKDTTNISTQTSKYLDEFFVNPNHIDKLCLKNISYSIDTDVDLFYSKVLSTFVNSHGNQTHVEMLKDVISSQPFSSKCKIQLESIFSFYNDYAYDVEGCLYKVEEEESGLLGYILYALLYGNGQFTKTLSLALKTGYNTEELCTMVGTLIGSLVGIEGINKSRWINSYNDVLCLGIEPNGIVISQEIMNLLKLIDKTYESLDALNHRFYLESAIASCRTTESLNYNNGVLVISGSNLTLNNPAIAEFPLCYPNGKSFCCMDCTIKAKVTLKTDSEILQVSLNVITNTGIEIKSINKNFIKEHSTTLELSLNAEQAMTLKTMQIVVTTNSTKPEAFSYEIAGYTIIENPSYQKLVFNEYTSESNNCMLKPLKPNGVEIIPIDNTQEFSYNLITIKECEYTFQAVFLTKDTINDIHIKCCWNDELSKGFYLTIKSDGTAYWSLDGINPKNSTKIVQSSNGCLNVRLVCKEKLDCTGYRLEIHINDYNCFNLKLDKSKTTGNISVHCTQPIICCGYTFILPSCVKQFPEINTDYNINPEYIELLDTYIDEISDYTLDDDDVEEDIPPVLEEDIPPILEDDIPPILEDEVPLILPLEVENDNNDDNIKTVEEDTDEYNPFDAYI
ncbi:MAG: hypothetical protein ACI4WH_01625 [Oscillospiraceae bacterium]